MEKQAMISTIQHYSTKDGPGIRSTVFFVGCNLRCKWCANPELMLPGVKYMYFQNRCIKCGACVKAAADNSISLTPAGCRIDRLKCRNIDECSAVCPVDAYEQVGFYITADELTERLTRDKVFYDRSGGGVTFSGGEPGLQSEFIVAAAGKLRQQGIHTALDTAGYLPWNILKNIIQAMDMVLYDIKAFDKDIHNRCTGVDNGIILDNLKKIADMKKEIIVRMVIVPGWNDDIEDIKKRIDYLAALGSAIVRLDILNYHDLGRGKYQRLGIEYPIPSDRGCSDEVLMEMKQRAVSKGLAAFIEN